MIRQTPITCDVVFQRLTAGPFCGDGDGEQQIELHLSCCNDCRKLADAMRPAIGLVHESLDEFARMDLPVYVSDPASVKSDVLGTVRAELASANRASPETPPLIGLTASAPTGLRTICAWILVATLLLCLVAVTALWLEASARNADPVASHPPGSSAMYQALESGELGEKHLMSFTASTGCEAAADVTRNILHPPARAQPHSFSFQDLKALCCTSCHVSEKASLSSRNEVALIAAACSQCHGVPNKVN